MIKCSSADRYKARREPKCNGGKPCDVCSLKWEYEQRFKAIESKLNSLQEQTDPHRGW